ncbi:MAG: hypothetical protein K6E19_02210 [Lachnospiraceae bacterium]|nr:hypothetical protein [Lachnospiraceae bacterium]
MFKRSAVIISLLVLLISACLFPFVIEKGTSAPSYNTFGTGVTAGDGYYYLDSGNGGIRLFLLDANGTVSSIFADANVSASDICICDGKVYVLLNETQRRDETGVIRSYRLKSFTTELEPLDYTVPFEIHAGEKATDLSVVGGRVVITAVSVDASFAEVYSISLEELEQLYKDSHSEDSEEEVEEPVVVADSVFLEQAGTNRFIAEAAFRDGKLLLRTDADEAEGVFAEDKELRSVLANIRLTFSQKVTLSSKIAIYWTAGTFILLIITIMLIILFRGHTKMFYSGVALEVVLLGIMIVIFLAYRQDQTRYIASAREQYSVNSLRVLAGEVENITFTKEGPEWYASADYRKLQRSINRFVSREYDSSVIYDTFAVNTVNCKIICSADGRNNIYASDVYGDSKIWEVMGYKNPTDAYALDVPGHSFEAVAISMSDVSPYRLVAVFDVGTAGSDKSGIYRMIRDLIILFTIASAVTIFVMWLTSRDLRSFDRALGEVAINGKSPYLKPTNPVGTDFTDMWNSLREIEKKIEKINYSSYKRYEAYYRFAPKNIEKILGRDSIMDVESGDRASLFGTLSIITNDAYTGIEDRVSHLNGLLDFFKTHSEEEGVLVSEREGLASLDVLFTDEVTTTEEFAIDYIRDCRESRGEYKAPSILLHRDSFIYGVTGNEDQSKAFLLSRGLSQLHRLSEWIEKMNISIVVTEDIKEREIGRYDYRYIGFIEMDDSGREVKLYELLDGCPKKEREIKLISRNKFEEAIKLFYQSDYYMARNSFSELLKVNPSDELIRWYLFESERLLDTPPKIGEKPGAIHTDR